MWWHVSYAVMNDIRAFSTYLKAVLWRPLTLEQTSCGDYMAQLYVCGHNS